MNISILTICTGKYSIFFDEFYKSVQDKFLKNHNKCFFVFTDGDIKKENNIIKIDQQKLGWPYDTMLRFKMFNSIKEELLNFEYVFFFNVNMIINKEIGDEILPGSVNDFLVGVEHPGYYKFNKFQFPYERRECSNFYIPYNQGLKYFQGCFNGGRSYEYLLMSEVLDKKINEDLSKKIIPIWHDESALNWYYNYNSKTPLSLTPEYAHPESDDSYESKLIRYFNFEKKIIQLDKNKFGGHQFLRN